MAHEPSHQYTWLNQVHEEVLEPDRRICDAHHHLWDTPRSRYLLDELMFDLNTGHRVLSTVFVECMAMYRAEGPLELAPVGETEFVQGIAAMSASGQYGDTRVAGAIISYADLNLGDDVADVLRAHVAASPNRFRGIRHAAAWDPSAEVKNSHTRPTQGMMLEENFNRGLSVLAEMDLVFDAWFYHHQMLEFVTLAKAHPELTIVLDHFGGPLGIGPHQGRWQQIFEQWQEDIVLLKDCPNVHFKLGGINMERNGYGWHQRPQPASSDELVDATGPYYEFCINQFGADRCMFESNFPVDRDSCSYHVLWNAFKKLAQNCSEAEKDQLFYGTATRIYRVEAHPDD